MNLFNLFFSFGIKGTLPFITFRHFRVFRESQSRRGLKEKEAQEGKVTSQVHMGNEWKKYDLKHGVLVPVWFLSLMLNKSSPKF